MREFFAGGRTCVRAMILCASGFLAAACHDVVNSGGSAAFTVGGNVAGLVQGASVELANSDGDSVTVGANGVFAFAVSVPVGATYGVTVFEQPSGESCTVGNGSGTVMGAGIVNVSVVCTPEVYGVGGSVSGLLPGRSLVLQDNGGSNSTVSADGAFSFSAGVPSGSNYAVTVRSQPDGQSCAIINGSGTIAAGDVLDVSVVCSDDTYNVGVAVTGVNAAGLTLEDNGGDPLSVSRNGSFNFDTPIASGSTYAVTVSGQPLGEVCTVTQGAGIVTDANVAGIAVACVPNLYSVAGSLSGLYAGRSLVVQDDGGNSTTLAADGAFSFTAPVASGSNYAVTVATQPVGQTCSISGGSGTVAGANVAGVAISCSDNTYNVGFTVSGLIDSGLILQDNGADNLAVSSNGTFNFPTPQPTGSNYSVTILTQPANETCAVTNATGTVVGTNITDILVTCTGEWTWVGGSNTSGAAGLYGIEGTASTGNMPGARYEAATFADASGQFWLFGGYGFDSAGSSGDLNDLWSYDPGSGAWTWVSGSNLNSQQGSYAAPGPLVPGARAQASAWTDASGDFWLFGGFGYDSGGARSPLNDLWKFNRGTGSWTWVSGADTVLAFGSYGTPGVAAAGNVPGARTAAVSWIDSGGNLWLFGGQGNTATNSGFLNDLWEFSPRAGNWTWVSGTSARNQAGSYGTQGTPAAGNAPCDPPAHCPGGRSGASSWVDSLGNLWLFGGYGYDYAGNPGYLNDLWEFNPIAGTWTWVSGSNTSDGNSSYGSVGIPSASNVPGARDVATSWVDASGNFWLFGGFGLDSTNAFLNAGNLGDLWEFSPATGLWTWIAGPSTVGYQGSYGSQGTPAFSNAPSGRQAAAPWVDVAGDLWLLGGYGADSSGNLLYYNDLWKYTP
ncbi:MAG TPA: kelch repeat-containing protein [Steroidobacteraceae bacterium]